MRPRLRHVSPKSFVPQPRPTFPSHFFTPFLATLHPQHQSGQTSPRYLNVFSIFDRKSVAKSLQKPSLLTAHQQWVDALDSGRVADIQRTFKLLLQWIHATPPSDPSMSSTKPSDTAITRMMDVLSRAPNPDVDFLRSAFSELPETLGIRHGSSHYAALVRALTANGRNEEAFSLLEQAIATLGRSVDANLWEIMMDGYRRNGDLSGMGSVWEHMKATGVIPSSSCYRTYVSGLFDAYHTGDNSEVSRNINELLKEIQGMEIRNDPSFLAVLMSGYFAAHKWREARSIAETVTSVLDKDQEIHSENEGVAEMLDALLMVQRHLRDDAGFWMLFGKLLQWGYRPSSATVASIMRGLGKDASPDQLRQVAGRLGVDAEDGAWAVLMNTASAREDLKAALSIYNEAMTSISPSLELVKGIFASRQYHLPDGRTLMDIYHDLQAAEGSSSSILTSSTTTLKLYEDLLIAIADCSDRLLVPKILTILVDMRNRSLAFDPLTTSSLIQSLMHSAWSYNAAYNIYSNVRGLATKIDEQGYRDILNTFTQIRVARGSAPFYPPPRLFFSIVKDMTDDGHFVEIDIFHLLFRKLRKSALPVDYRHIGSPSENPNNDLLLDVKRAHALFRMYAAVTPDVTFLNLMMDTYSRSGGFHEAMSIWEEEILPARIMDGRSVSIVLDTCSHYGAVSPAFAVWKYLTDKERRNPQQPISAKIWETWIECLCRLDLVDEVRRTLVHELGTPETRKSSNVPSWRVYATDSMLRIPINFPWASEAKARRATIALTLKKHFDFNFRDHSSNEDETSADPPSDSTGPKTGKDSPDANMNP